MSDYFDYTEQPATGPLPESVKRYRRSKERREMRLWAGFGFGTPLMTVLLLVGAYWQAAATLAFVLAMNEAVLRWYERYEYGDTAWMTHGPNSEAARRTGCRCERCTWLGPSDAMAGWS